MRLSDQKLCNGCLQHCHIENPVRNCIRQEEIKSWKQFIIDCFFHQFQILAYKNYKIRSREGLTEVQTVERMLAGGRVSRCIPLSSQQLLT